MDDGAEMEWGPGEAGIVPPGQMRGWVTAQRLLRAAGLTVGGAPFTA